MGRENFVSDHIAEFVVIEVDRAHAAAAFKGHDIKSCGGELVDHDTATRARPDHAYVVLVLTRSRVPPPATM